MAIEWDTPDKVAWLIVNRLIDESAMPSIRLGLQDKSHDIIQQEIEAFTKRQNGQGWVRVEDRLPHTHTVLGYIVDRPAHPVFVGGEPFVDTVCYFPKHDPQRMYTENDASIPESGEWRMSGMDDEKDRGVVIITHWQPLPAPPTGDAPTEKK